MESSWSVSHTKLVDGCHVSTLSHTFCISVRKEAYKWNWICRFLLSLIHICILFVKAVARQNIQYCCVFLMNRPLPKWLFLFLAGACALVLKWLEPYSVTTAMTSVRFLHYCRKTVRHSCFLSCRQHSWVRFFSIQPSNLLLIGSVYMTFNIIPNMDDLSDINTVFLLLACLHFSIYYTSLTILRWHRIS